MGLLLLIPGIILLDTNGWFKDQHKVGAILTWVGVLLLATQVAVVLLGALALRERRKRW